jgi:hypothetical protein
MNILFIFISALSKKRDQGRPAHNEVVTRVLIGSCHPSRQLQAKPKKIWGRSQIATSPKARTRCRHTITRAIASFFATGTGHHGATHNLYAPRSGHPQANLRLAIPPPVRRQHRSVHTVAIPRLPSTSYQTINLSQLLLPAPLPPPHPPIAHPIHLPHPRLEPAFRSRRDDDDFHRRDRRRCGLQDRRHVPPGLCGSHAGTLWAAADHVGAQSADSEAKAWVFEPDSHQEWEEDVAEEEDEGEVEDCLLVRPGKGRFCGGRMGKRGRGKCIIGRDRVYYTAFAAMCKSICAARSSLLWR